MWHHEEVKDLLDKNLTICFILISYEKHAFPDI